MTTVDLEIAMAMEKAVAAAAELAAKEKHAIEDLRSMLSKREQAIVEASAKEIKAAYEREYEHEYNKALAEAMAGVAGIPPFPPPHVIPRRIPAGTAQQLGAGIGMPPLAKPPAPSPATKKFLDFILHSITPIEWMYVTAVLVPLPFLPRVLNAAPNVMNVANFGSFFGCANVILVRFTPINGMTPTDAVYEIPEQVVKELVAEDVERKLVD